MIGTKKRCLQKVLGHRQVNEETLNPILVSIEATITSRPLLQTVDTTVLTSAHILHGQKLTTIPTGLEPLPSRDLKREYWLQQQALAIDEVTVKFKGRVLFKQYIPKKRKRFSIKMFKLFDSTGYIYMT